MSEKNNTPVNENESFEANVRLKVRIPQDALSRLKIAETEAKSHLKNKQKSDEDSSVRG